MSELFTPDAVSIVFGYYHDEEAEAILNSLKKANAARYDTVSMPREVRSDNSLQLWAFLVVMYGDWGINPQNGWIIREWYKEAISLMEDICA